MKIYDSWLIVRGLTAAEKRDKDKHEMLKEAKKRWDDKKMSEEMMKHSVEDMHGEFVADDDILERDLSCWKWNR